MLIGFLEMNNQRFSCNKLKLICIVIFSIIFCCGITNYVLTSFLLNNNIKTFQPTNKNKFLINSPQRFQVLPISLTKNNTETSNQNSKKHESKINVLSYSLYGADKRYNDAIIMNSKLFSHYYPGWQMRVYHDNTVPNHIISQLKKGNVDLKNMSGSLQNKRSWRFLACIDSDVLKCCSRDCDSYLSARERAAVAEWENSNYSYHVMRDHPSHRLFGMSAGLWCSRGNLSSFFSDLPTSSDFFADTDWLNKNLWPKISQDVLQHDSFSCQKYQGSKAFPTHRKNLEHVGSVYINGAMRQSDVDLLQKAKQPLQCSHISDIVNKNFKISAKNPYDVKKILWGQFCDFKTDTLYSASIHKNWRIIISSDKNINYLAFIPSISQHWQKHNILVNLALVGNYDTELNTELQKYVNVTFFPSIINVPDGHTAKLARSYLASQFESDLVTIVDIDFYLLQFNEWREQLKCAPISSLFTLGWNMYKETEDEGKTPMYLSTAISKTFADFLGTSFLNFETWVETLQNIHVFDKKENPYQEYGKFSDESLFRAKLANKSIYVVWMNRPNFFTRIDRKHTTSVSSDEVNCAGEE